MKGLRLLLDDEQQGAWLEGSATPDDGNRPHSDELEPRPARAFSEPKAQGSSLAPT